MSELASKPQSMIYVVEDDVTSGALVRKVGETLGYPVQEFASAEAFLAAFDPQRPGCLVTDIHLGGMSGIALQQELRRRNVGLPLIIITSGPVEVPQAVEAMHNQAVDFIVKPVNPEHLADRIRQALQLDQTQRATAAERSDAQTRLARLTPREREVLQCVVSGMSNKQIAAHLHLSEKTVEVHRGNVMRKSEAESVPDLVRLALAGGQGKPLDR